MTVAGLRRRISSEHPCCDVPSSSRSTSLAIFVLRDGGIRQQLEALLGAERGATRRVFDPAAGRFVEQPQLPPPGVPQAPPP